MGVWERGEKTIGESIEPKSNISKDNWEGEARKGEGSRVSSWKLKQKTFKGGSEKLSNASESSNRYKKCPPGFK